MLTSLPERAAAALRNMYSSNLVARHELDSLWEVLAQTGSSIDICSVRSEDNASDMASRNVTFFFLDMEHLAPRAPRCNIL